MTAHARLGPSKLKSAKLCPGSVNAAARVPRLPSEFAAEGTLLHDLLADCLSLDFEPDDFVDQTRVVDGFTFKITRDLVECLYDFIDWVREREGTLYVEQKVFLDPYMPGQFGTLDLGILLGDTLTIADFKSGFRIVPVYGNYQLRAYAIGFIETFLKPKGIIPKKIVLIIEQPRAPNAPRYWEPWEISYDELMEFADEMAEIWKAANDPNAPLVAGVEQCLMCDVKDAPGGCRAFVNFMVELLDLMGLGFANLDQAPKLLETDGFSVEQRSYLVIHADMIRAWLKTLESQSLSDALVGNPTPRLKAVEGPSGHRKWEDETKAAEIMVEAVGADKTFTKKVISPAGAEKLFKPGRKKPGNPEVLEKLQSLIVMPELKPMLVLDSDPRPAIQTVEDEDFDDDL